MILRAMERQEGFGVPLRPRHKNLQIPLQSRHENLRVPLQLRHENHVCCSPILQNPIWAPEISYLQLPPNGIRAAHDRLQLALLGQHGSSTASPSNIQSREQSSGERTETERSSSRSSMSSQQPKSTIDYSANSSNCPEPLLGQEIRPTLSLPALKNKIGKKVGHYQYPFPGKSPLSPLTILCTVIQQLCVCAA